MASVTVTSSSGGGETEYVVGQVQRRRRKMQLPQVGRTPLHFVFRRRLQFNTSVTNDSCAVYSPGISWVSCRAMSAVWESLTNHEVQAWKTRKPVEVGNPPGLETLMRDQARFSSASKTLLIDHHGVPSPGHVSDPVVESWGVR